MDDLPKMPTDLVRTLYRPIPGTAAARVIAEHIAVCDQAAAAAEALVGSVGPSAYSRAKRCFIGAFSPVAPLGWKHLLSNPGVVVPDTKTEAGKALNSKLKALRTSRVEMLAVKLGCSPVEFLVQTEQSGGWLIRRFNLYLHAGETLVAISSSLSARNSEFHFPTCPQDCVLVEGIQYQEDE